MRNTSDIYYQQQTPFEDTWFRFPKVTPRKVANDPRHLMLDFSGGSVEHYNLLDEFDFNNPKPTLITRALTLGGQLSDDYQEPPYDDVLAFFRDYGPLGLIYNQNRAVRNQRWIKAGLVISRPDSSPLLMRGEYLEKNRIVAKDKGLQQKLSQGLAVPSRSLLAHGYSEHWRLVHCELRYLYQVWDEWKATKDPTLVNLELRGAWQTFIEPRGRRWGYGRSFPSLLDALYISLAQKILENRRLVRCRCGVVFDTTDIGRRKHHDKDCMLASSREQSEENRKGPVQSEKRRLRALAVSRRDSGDIDEDEYAKIIKKLKAVDIIGSNKDEAKKAKALKQFQKIEKDHPVLLPHSRERKSA